MRCIDYKRRAMFISLIFCLLAGTVMAFLHEPWADEAQSWAMAKNLNFFQLVAAIKTEGHPILYHLLLKPFTYILPFRFAGLSSLGFATIGLCCLYKSKIDYRLFILFCLSPSVWYFTIAFARSYALCLAFFGLIAYLWGLRDKHPILLGLVFALSFSVHFMFTAVTAFLALIFGIEQIISIKNKFKEHKFMALREIRPELFTGLLLLLGVLLAFNQFMLVDLTKGAGTYNAPFEYGGIYDICNDLAHSLAMCFANTAIAKFIFIYSVVIFLIVVLARACLDLKTSFYSISALTSVVILFGRVSLTTPQKATFVLYIFVFASLLYVPKVKKTDGFNTMLALLLTLTLTLYYYPHRDIYEDFDGSYTLANKISELVPEGSKIGIMHDASDYATVQYLEDDYDIYQLYDADMKGGYIQWSSYDNTAEIVKLYQGKVDLYDFIQATCKARGFESGTKIYILLPVIEIGYPYDAIDDSGNATREFTEEEYAKVHDMAASEVAEHYDVLCSWHYDGTLYMIEGFLIHVTVE